MSPSLGRIIIYTKKIPEMIDFYRRYFGYSDHQIEGDRIVELTPPATGFVIMLHPMGKGRKEGQTLVKLVFDVENVEAFCARAAKNGLKFGAIHKADGYVFANAKDPAKNSISVSSRAFA